MFFFQLFAGEEFGGVCCVATGPVNKIGHSCVTDIISG
jgi:hypothetical protein